MVTPHQEPQPLWEKLGMEKDVFDQLPPATRLGLKYTHDPQPPEERRPYRPPAPADVRKQWEHLSGTEQMTKYREWCDQQPRP